MDMGQKLAEAKKDGHPLLEQQYFLCGKGRIVGEVRTHERCDVGRWFVSASRGSIQNCVRVARSESNSYTVGCGFAPRARLQGIGRRLI
jgi:hypothetical protein